MSFITQNDHLCTRKVETAPYGTNAYILVCQATQESVLIDAPAEANRIMENLKGTNPKFLLITHNHFDHTGILRELKDRLNIPVAAHPADAGRLPVAADLHLNDGNVVSFGEIGLKVLHTPGHTPGSVCFHFGHYLFSGDTLFPNGPGRTGTPAAFEQILKSLEEKIFVLSDDTLVFPGHGASTVLKKEKDAYAIFSSRAHLPDLCGDVLWLSS